MDYELKNKKDSISERINSKYIYTFGALKAAICDGIFRARTAKSFIRTWTLSDSSVFTMKSLNTYLCIESVSAAAVSVFEGTLDCTVHRVPDTFSIV